MITTVSTDQTEILRNIMDLYHIQNFHADFTYSTGAFWRDLPKPTIRCDIDDSHSDLTLVADIRNLPFGDGVLHSAVIDLPFLHAHGKASIIGNRFSSVRSQAELDDLHRAAALEAARVLAKGAVLVWKCQDIVESGKQVWNHIRVFDHCLAAGFKATDLFILIRKNVVVGHNHHDQVHARKCHSYFWVFAR